MHFKAIVDGFPKQFNDFDNVGDIAAAMLKVPNFLRLLFEKVYLSGFVK